MSKGTKKFDGYLETINNNAERVGGMSTDAALALFGSGIGIVVGLLIPVGFTVAWQCIFLAACASTCAAGAVLPKKIISSYREHLERLSQRKHLNAATRRQSALDAVKKSSAIIKQLVTPPEDVKNAANKVAIQALHELENSLKLGKDVEQRALSPQTADAPGMALPASSQSERNHVVVRLQGDRDAPANRKFLQILRDEDGVEDQTRFVAEDDEDSCRIAVWSKGIPDFRLAKDNSNAIVLSINTY